MVSGDVQRGGGRKGARLLAVHDGLTVPECCGSCGRPRRYTSRKRESSHCGDKVPHYGAAIIDCRNGLY